MNTHRTRLDAVHAALRGEQVTETESADPFVAQFLREDDEGEDSREPRISTRAYGFS